MPSVFLPRVVKSIAMSAGVVTLALALVSCSLLAFSGAKATETLTIATPVAPSSLNPALALSGRAAAVFTPAYEPLIRLSQQGEIQPGLATSWTVSKNLDSITFSLRTGALFSNGEAVTAASVRGSVEYFQRAKGPYAGLLKNLRAIETPNDSTVTFTFSSPQPGLVSLFSSVFNVGNIIAPAGVANPALLSGSTLGAGAYVLDSERSIPGSTYVFTPNSNYVDQQKVLWPGITMTVFPDQNQAMTAFKNGQVMLLVADPMTAQANAGTLPRGTQTITVPAQWSGIVLSDRSGKVVPALKDVRVRQALNYATDRKAITSALFGQFAAPASQLHVEGYVGFDKSFDSAYPYDVDKAKKLLAEAGYDKGLSIPVGYITNALNDAELALISAQWAKVNVKVVGVPVKNLSEFAVLGGAQKVGALLAQAFSASPDITFEQTLSSAGVYNIYGSTSPELSGLVSRAMSAPQDEQETAWKAVHQWVLNEAWFDIVAAVPNIVFASSAVKSVDLGRLPVIDPLRVTPS